MTDAQLKERLAKLTIASPDVPLWKRILVRLLGSQFVVVDNDGGGYIEHTYRTFCGMTVLCSVERYPHGAT